MIRFPISTPLVSRSAVLSGREVIVIDGVQFEDGRRRVVVGQEVTDATMEALTEALEQYERLDGMRRWFADLVTENHNLTPEQRQRWADHRENHADGSTP